MAIGIIVTSELKSLNDGKNPQTNILFSSYAVGNIRTLNEYPKIFYSPTYKTGQLTGGYNKLNDFTIYESDGFYPIIEPVDGVDYNSATQYLGSLFFDTTDFKYNIIDYTPEELAERETQQQESELTVYIESLINDGVSYYDYIQREIIKAYFYNEYSLSAVNNLNVLSDIMGVYEDKASQIIRGSWVSARDSLSATTFANAKAESLNVEFKAYISDYVNNNYETAE